MTTLTVTSHDDVPQTFTLTLPAIEEDMQIPLIQRMESALELAFPQGVTVEVAL